MIENTAMRIRLERVRAFMTMGDLAQNVDVTYQTVSQWERGTRIPRGEHLIKLSHVFGCSTDYLLGLDNERTHRATGGK